MGGFGRPKSPGCRVNLNCEKACCEARSKHGQLADLQTTVRSTPLQGRETAGIYEQGLPPHLLTVLSPADIVRGSPLQTDHQRTGPAR